MIRIIVWLVAIIIGAILLFAVVIPLILKAAGYQLEPGWKVAELAFERRDVSMCDDIIAYDLLLGPPTHMQRTVCIRKYASLSHDPTVCASLLPNPYAISCIGAATNFPQQECIQTHPNTLNCYIKEKDILKVYDVPQIDNCEAYKKYNNHQVIHWCLGQRVKKYGELDQCLEDASSSLEKDDCYYQRAMKIDDIRLEFCEKITSNALMRGDCSETVKAWLKYPELRPEKN